MSHIVFSEANFPSGASLFQVERKPSAALWIRKKDNSTGAVLCRSNDIRLDTTRDQQIVMKWLYVEGCVAC